MSTQSTKHSTSVAAAVAAGVVLFSLLSPAMAASDQNNPAVLTSHSPWLAPTGHRQPTRADVAQGELLSAWERQRQVLDTVRPEAPDLPLCRQEIRAGRSVRAGVAHAQVAGACAVGGRGLRVRPGVALPAKSARQASAGLCALIPEHLSCETSNVTILAGNPFANTFQLRRREMERAAC